MARILITGASGLIGRILQEGLHDHDLLGLDLRGADVEADTTDLDAILPAFEGREIVIDLAALSRVDLTWEEVYRNNIPSTLNVLEASKRAGVRRVIFASSNHVTGLHENDPPYREILRGEVEGLDPDSVPLLGPDAAIRPDGFYGIGKAMGEAAARFYAERHALSVHCLRIGTVNRSDRPEDPRQHATLLSHADLARLLLACMKDGPGFGVFYGVSRNTWRIWELPEGIPYDPQDDAERFRYPSSRRPSADCNSLFGKMRRCSWVSPWTYSSLPSSCGILLNFGSMKNPGVSL